MRLSKQKYDQDVHAIKLIVLQYFRIFPNQDWFETSHGGHTVAAGGSHQIQKEHETQQEK